MSEWRQRQVERQARFWEQIRAGKTNTAACDAVGVERHQGYRWRKAAGGRIPAAPRVVSGRFLSLEERLAIADLHLAGQGVRAIARELRRSASTISRELARNQVDATAAPRVSARPRRRAYAPYAAHRRAELRGRRPKASKLEHPLLAAFVQEKMELKWSPQQISDELARTAPGEQDMQVSHETIYQSLYVQGRGHLRADLHKQLRTGRAMRRPHRSTGPGKVNLSDIIPLSDRPAEADDRAVPGHWESQWCCQAACTAGVGGVACQVRLSRSRAQRTSMRRRARAMTAWLWVRPCCRFFR